MPLGGVRCLDTVAVVALAGVEIGRVSKALQTIIFLYINLLRSLENSFPLILKLFYALSDFEYLTLFSVELPLCHHFGFIRLGVAHLVIVPGGHGLLGL